MPTLITSSDVLAKVMERCRESLQIKPDDVAAANNLAWLLATFPTESLRDGDSVQFHTRKSTLRRQTGCRA